ncbi:ABC transporter ATP-binding protein [Candidatus Poriferisodalis sp.]|uniref:ABC transporter ATP-binding protein n=1 Tax=Candidatus Poriferisodalis sp. TaxID=3101277 RepID=UPI003B01E6C4
MLDIDGLTVRYGSISAVRDVSLSVSGGEVVGLIGPNGAGKTTLLNTVAGLLHPASGHVRLDGTDITGFAPDRLLRLGVALVPEHRRLFTDLTVVENLRVGAATLPGRERSVMLDEIADLFDVLRQKWTTPAGYLSGGEAQQLAIARALMSRPRLLMMDEPSLGLAPVLVDVVFELIDQLRAQGRTLLVVEQNAARMLEVSDRAYVLRSGEMVASGSGAELARRSDLFETFVGSVVGDTEDAGP